MSLPLRTDGGQLEELAELLAERLERRPLPSRLVGVREVAEYLSVDADWVYTHASELGVRRLGTGPKAPLRFDLREVDEKLSSCTVGRKSTPPELTQQKRLGRRRAKPMGTGVRLLPIRGISDDQQRGLGSLRPSRAQLDRENPAVPKRRPMATGS